MPNVGALLRDEITRLARREIRGLVEPVRKASAQYRREIAALKRQVAQQQRRLSLLERKAARSAAATPAAPGPAQVRFVARGLHSQRTRLGLSASNYGRLVGVSSQTIYNWEQGVSKPHQEQLAKLSALRGLGKREAEARLAQLRPPAAGKRRKS
jgi:DNA-binding transcriptional regulator YiaG